MVEDLAIKQDLLDRLEPHLGAATIVSSNTSGIPLALIAQGRNASFRGRWIGTHFFNPPRYMRLVEIIPTADTDPAVDRAACRRSSITGSAKAWSSPETRPGSSQTGSAIFGALRSIEAIAGGDYTIEEVDAITGPVMGRPKSATFRTLDIAGLDVFARVADDLSRRLPSPEERARFAPPELVRRMVAAGMIGVKTGAGFYKRIAMKPVGAGFSPPDANQRSSCSTQPRVSGA